VTIATPRLDLVVVERPALEAFLRGEQPTFAFDPDDFLDGLEDVVRLRIPLLDADPSALPWLIRAIVLRAEQRAVGLINFHAPPDSAGVVEVGYQIHERDRRRGYAREALAAQIAWGAAHGARVIRACVAPANLASQALLVGFTHVGEQLDEVDGLELVYEMVVGSSATRPFHFVR
jgi:ribosomal-protein-alanine N-acetyltransferase